MATPDQANDNPQRSENLLPADDDTSSDDGRFEIAEEVSLDQQSDLARSVGKPPKGIASDALADTLKDDSAGKQ